MANNDRSPVRNTNDVIDEGPSLFSQIYQISGSGSSVDEVVWEWNSPVNRKRKLKSPKRNNKISSPTPLRNRRPKRNASSAASCTTSDTFKRFQEELTALRNEIARDDSYNTGSEVSDDIDVISNSIDEDDYRARIFTIRNPYGKSMSADEVMIDESTDMTISDDGWDEVFASIVIPEEGNAGTASAAAKSEGPPVTKSTNEEAIKNVEKHKDIVENGGSSSGLSSEMRAKIARNRCLALKRLSNRGANVFRMMGSSFQ